MAERATSAFPGVFAIARAGWLGCLCLGSLALASSSSVGVASAWATPPSPEDPPAPSMAWSVPAECPNRADLLVRTEALLGRPLGRPEDPIVVGSGRIEASGSGYTLYLSFDAPAPYSRMLESASCQELSDAAALILATTIDPLGASMEDEEPSEVVEPQTTATPNEIEPDVVSPSEAQPATAETDGAEPDGAEPDGVEQGPRRPMVVALRLGGLAALGPLPSVSGGPASALVLAWPLRLRSSTTSASIRLEFGGAYLAPRRASSPEAELRVSLWHLGLRGCGVPELGRVSLPLCLGVQAGALHGRVRGDALVSPGAGALAWAALDFGAAFTFAFTPRVALWAGVDGTVLLVRPGFSVGGLGTLHRAASAGVQATVGIEFRWPIAVAIQRRQRP